MPSNSSLVWTRPGPSGTVNSLRYHQETAKGAVGAASEGAPGLALGSGLSCIEDRYWAAPARGNAANMANRLKAAALPASVLDEGEWSGIMRPPVSRIRPLYRKNSGWPNASGSGRATPSAALRGLGDSRTESTHYRSGASGRRPRPRPAARGASDPGSALKIGDMHLGD